MYRNIKSLCWVPGTNLVLLVNYTSKTNKRMGGAQRHLLHWCLGSERERWKRAETIVRGGGFYARTQSHDPKPHETGRNCKEAHEMFAGHCHFLSQCTTSSTVWLMQKRIALCPYQLKPSYLWWNSLTVLEPPWQPHLTHGSVLPQLLDERCALHTHSCCPMQMKHFPKVQHPLSRGPLCMLLSMTLNAFKVEGTHRHWDGCPDGTSAGRKRRGWCTPQRWPWLGLLLMHWNVWVGLWYPALHVHPVMLKEFRGEVVKTQNIAKSLPNILPQSAG